jgi:hypothetical protein
MGQAIVDHEDVALLDGKLDGDSQPELDLFGAVASGRVLVAVITLLLVSHAIVPGLGSSLEVLS